MEYPILFKNVNENYSNFYKDEERGSNIIGFVNPDDTSEFGYIISGGRQYGLSYQTLKGYIDTAYNKSIKYTQNYVDSINDSLRRNINTISTVVQQHTSKINGLETTVTQNLAEAKAYTVEKCNETLEQANANAAAERETAKNSAKEYTNTTVDTTKTELTALITNEIQKLSNTVDSYYSYVTDRMMNYSTEEIRNCSSTSHNANIKAIRINQTALKTYLIGSVSIKVRTSSDSTIPAYMIVKTPSESSYIAKSINTIKQSDYPNKYITWYFDTFLINAETDYVFKLIDSSGNEVLMTPHTVGEYTNNDLVCIGPAGYDRPDFRPAFGVNLSNIYSNDIAINKNSIKELKQSISNLSALVEHLYTSLPSIDKPTIPPTAEP